MKPLIDKKALVSGVLGATLILVLAATAIVTHRSAVVEYLFALSSPTSSTTSNLVATSTIATLREELIKQSEIQESKKLSYEDRIVRAVRKAKPAVVSIVISKDVPIYEQYLDQAPGPFNDPFFRQFFGGDVPGFNFQVPKQREKGTEKRDVGAGTGFLVSSNGLIVTNRHVVADKTADYTVFTNEGKKYQGKVIARDSFLDIALIKIVGTNFPHLTFANSDRIEIGQTAIAIGNALAEFRNTVSVGIVSGLSRSITAGDMSGRSEHLEGVIQSDAAINPGNSGGPLVNLDGMVMGVNVAVAQGSQNIGFSILSNGVATIVQTVETHGKIVRPFLGVRYVEISPELKEKNKLPVDYGALVLRGEKQDELAVSPSSPADRAGIVENDIILEVNGVKLTTDKSLASFIREKKVGDILRLTILHRGERKNVNVTLAEIPE